MDRLPVELALAQCQADVQEVRQSLIQKARKDLEGENWRELEDTIESLIQSGHLVEALTLKAKLYRCRGQLLSEYQIWHDLTKIIDSGELHKVVQYGLGDVLLALQEPDLAARAFDAADGFEDVVQRLASVQKHPLFGHPDAVRVFIGQQEPFLGELEKSTVLDKEFRAVVLVRQVPFDKQVFHKDINLKSFATQLENELRSKCLPETRAVYYDPQQPLRTIHWIRVVPQCEGTVPRCFQYALSFLAVPFWHLL